MLHLKIKETCTGCSACKQICPKQCISMQPDKEGFLYPFINEDICIDCGMCEKICSVMHPFAEGKPLSVYASVCKQEKKRLLGSSGGVFLPLAEKIIEQQGVVFGASFNKKWEVVHCYTELSDGLFAFCKSKYVQSQIGNSYQQAESFLKSGRKVLFSGTPCQIAGLHSYLRKEYINLFTIDFICHGVPSPKVWQIYLKEINKKIQNKYHNPSLQVSSIDFRDKKTGWNDSSLSIHYVGQNFQKASFSEKKSKNMYLQGFLQNLYLRPSCHMCPYKQLNSKSDITLGDFWGVGKICPEFHDNKGVSSVIINTYRGETLWNKITIKSKKEIFDNLVRANPALASSTSYNPKRSLFFSNLEKSPMLICKDIKKLIGRNYKQRIHFFIKNILYRTK